MTRLPDDLSPILSFICGKPLLPLPHELCVEDFIAPARTICKISTFNIPSNDLFLQKTLASTSAWTYH